MRHWFGFTRNHYDRIGHFAQGFVPAIAAREILIRVAKYRRDAWLNVVVFSICAAISCEYANVRAVLLSLVVPAQDGEPSVASRMYFGFVVVSVLR